MPQNREVGAKTVVWVHLFKKYFLGFANATAPLLVKSHHHQRAVSLSMADPFPLQDRRDIAAEPGFPVLLLPVLWRFEKK